MVALSIVALSVLTITLSWSGNYGRIRKIKIYNDMAYLLETKMKEFELLYRGLPLEKIPKNLTGKFEKKYSKYIWTFQSQNFELPDLESLFLEQNTEIGEFDSLIFKQVKNLLTTSIKEIKLSVSTKIRKKEITQSVATYFTTLEY